MNKNTTRRTLTTAERASVEVFPPRHLMRNNNEGYRRPDRIDRHRRVADLVGVSRLSGETQHVEMEWRRARGCAGCRGVIG